MGNVFFVVWRESFEAFLVIGIIYSWIKRHPDTQNGMKFLWGGVALGSIVSILLAVLIYFVFNQLDGSDLWQSLFMMTMELLACILIVQMVYWMNKHGKEMSKVLIHGISQSTQKHSWWGALFIVAIAIAREGSEIVVFLSSIIMGLSVSTALPFLTEVSVGFIVALMTLVLFLVTSKIVSWRWFLTITGVILLFLASTLLLKANDTLMNLLLEYDVNITEFFYNPLWNTSQFLNDGAGIGNFLSSFFAYRSQPTAIDLSIFCGFWVIMVTIFWRGSYAHNKNR